MLDNNSMPKRQLGVCPQKMRSANLEHEPAAMALGLNPKERSPCACICLVDLAPANAASNDETNKGKIQPLFLTSD